MSALAISSLNDNWDREGHSPSAVEKDISILIVDDSEFDRHSLTRQCEKTQLPVEIQTASDLASMRTALDQHSYDLIFVDYRLAEGDGLQAREIIRDHQVNGQAATIMITGDAQPDIAVSAIKGGCLDYLSKNTLDTNALKSLIGSTMAQLRHHAQHVFRAEMALAQMEISQTVVDVVRNELRDERIISLLKQALGQTGTRSAQTPGFSASTIEVFSEFEVNQPLSFQFK